MNFPLLVSIRRRVLAGSLLLACQFTAQAGDLAARCADRAAVERVYDAHRTGTKPAFEQTMPAALLEKLVRDDLKKEAALERVYGVRITAPMVEAEVQRINATTRAPEMLTEIKAALGNEPAKFADVFARPIVVERTLRARFENDDALHAPQRRLAEAGRLRAREGKDVKDWPQLTWKLTPRPASDTAAPTSAAPGPTTATTSGGLYRNEATAQIAQELSSPQKGTAETYLDDLPADLQNVLRVQLRQPGDVSAIIETPSAFQCYLARECMAETLTVAVLTVPKLTCAEWLREQPQP